MDEFLASASEPASTPHAVERISEEQAVAVLLRRLHNPTQLDDGPSHTLIFAPPLDTTLH